MIGGLVGAALALRLFGFGNRGIAPVTVFPHGSLAVLAALYFGQTVPLALPRLDRHDSGRSARSVCRRGMSSSVVRSAATQDAQANEARFERGRRPSENKREDIPGGGPKQSQRKRSSYIPIFSMALLLSACGGEADVAESGPGPEPVVVYASYDDLNYLPQLFLEFTNETGIRVTVRHRDANTIVSEVIDDEGSPPADVLFADSVQGAWRAADEGALRPVHSEVLKSQIPENLRDVDRQWFAASVRIAALAYDSRTLDSTALSNYEALGDDAWKGRLCLTSSTMASNQTLVGMLMDRHDVRPAELIVRRWVANLALPPFKDQDAMLAAIDAGTCALGIAWLPQSAIADNDGATGATQFHVPKSAIADVEAIGVARHARQPEVGLKLIEWFIANAEHTGHVRDVDIESILSRNVGIAGWQGEDAIKLAERAAYR